MNIFHTIILSVIEGITEFLPISSTGHMILAADLMGISEDSFTKTFQVVIQLGAICAIVLLYWKRLFQGWMLYYKLAIAFVPTAIVGFLAYDFIKEYLFNSSVVAVSLIVGGLVLIFVDKKVASKKQTLEDIGKISYKNAFFIGCIQCFAMIPGVSRAGATIVGGVFRGLSKKQATEFSFLLALPTMFAATGYDIIKTSFVFTQYQIMILAAGIIISFVTAWVIVRIFLRYVERYGFKHFGYYRILLGVVFLLLFVL
jgi:undecaprenyl-diphosphatase